MTTDIADRLKFLHLNAQQKELLKNFLVCFAKPEMVPRAVDKLNKKLLPHETTTCQQRVSMAHKQSIYCLVIDNIRHEFKGKDSYCSEVLFSKTPRMRRKR
ncbi:hypothetical protein EGW08_002137 [Elysia chlorotica]|uniref:Uncharacterized protein n=1 Tax=Elysia chlorotica TaxID=188477 RepID=A0A3S0ZZR7_ELYCH|nr:hypothetical protein EGW08_002137 [Elysia chlorotica]